MLRADIDGSVYGVYERGAVNGIAQATVRLATFIMRCLAEDKSKAHSLEFACKIPDKMPDFTSAGGPAAEAYWQHFTPRRAYDQADAARRLVGALLETPHDRACSGYVWAAELGRQVWVGRPCDCEAWLRVESHLQAVASAWATHADHPVPESPEGS
jgi:hypothetical protein